MILGLDVSTSITGATILDMNGKMLYNESWDTRNKNKFPNLYQKAKLLKSEIAKIKKQFNVEQVYIEQSLQSFRSGFSSAKTLSTLARFNGIISWICVEILEIEPEMIAASSARKSAGIVIKRGDNSKLKSFEFVVDNEPSFVVEYTKKGNLKPGVTDRSDSWVIARAGLEICKNK